MPFRPSFVLSLSAMAVVAAGATPAPGPYDLVITPAKLVDGAP